MSLYLEWANVMLSIVFISAALIKTAATNTFFKNEYLFLNAIANQLRYPNSHTHYFSCALLYLFAEANSEAIQEQITRMLLERLIVNRPHPWGLLITFIELIKNPVYKFWQHEFVHCAPEIEKYVKKIFAPSRPSPSTASDLALTREAPPEKVVAPPENVVPSLQKVVRPPEKVVPPPKKVVPPPEKVVSPPKKVPPHKKSLPPTKASPKKIPKSKYRPITPVESSIIKHTTKFTAKGERKDLYDFPHNIRFVYNYLDD